MRRAAAPLRAAVGALRPALANGRRGAPALRPRQRATAPALGHRWQVASSALRVVRPASSTAEDAPAGSALRASATRLHEAFFGAEATARIAAEADAPADQAATLARLRQELAASEAEEMEVFLRGEVLPAGDGRRSVTVPTPVGPGGGAVVRNVKMVLPSADDIAGLLAKRREENYKTEKPEELLEVLEKFYKEKFLEKSADHVALLAAWGPKPLGDAQGEFSEIAALMAQSLGACRAVLDAAKKDAQFELNRTGSGRDCLVMPPANFALLGLKDAIHVLLQGFRVLMIVQPRFLPQFREVQKDLEAVGLNPALFEVLPGITPEADPATLHEALKTADRLQFTGSSAMFKSLVGKALELGNLRMENGGEVSGLNKMRFDGVSASHPAVVAGAAWAAMANNGELCTSASLIEFDPATGDTAASVKTALEGNSVSMGTNPEDASLQVLLKDGKTKSLEVKTEAAELSEWWEKTVLAVPQGGSPNTRTNQSLGHCIFAPSIDRAVELGLKEEASCIYMVGVPEGNAPSARAGTTGCKLPESAFGGMKSYTFAVAGDHDGVGSIQTVLNTAKRRGASWRDQEEVRAQYELTELAEGLIGFLNPKDQVSFTKQISSVLDIYAAFEPKVGAPYNGQPIVGAEGRSQLVSLKALRPTRKSLMIPKMVELPDEIVKVAALCEMSPLREIPVDLHVMDAPREGRLRVTDPLKSFLRVVQRQLNWKVHFHADQASMVSWLESSEYPPYFYSVKDKHLLPLEVLQAVAAQGGYLYEGLPDDALGLFRMLTATQAWTVACTEAQVPEATAALEKAWKEVGLREEPHEEPELVQPPKRDMDIGGGFNAGMDPEDDKDWAELSSDESSSLSSDDEDEAAKKDASKTPPSDSKATGDSAKPAAADAQAKPAADAAKDSKASAGAKPAGEGKAAA